ncbi:hypothetical protein BC834DRAFT_972687 [Gloeopeniophorella convolvens]|nr:hypothetical protein BC834DRAFT_972687 [Gloeopeniophorella convolvens]
MFVPDLLHEFELSVWKNTFVHLLRILVARGGDTIQMLNERFRWVPMFGCGTIRRFPANVADLKRIAARDYEDILQCAIPIFEGLLPSPHNEIVLDLLYIMATWHGYAKFRLHTDTTLGIFETVTIALGKIVCRFANTTCEYYQTRELKCEISAQGRYEARVAAKGNGTTRTTGSKAKKYKVHHTYKFHRLGDYPTAIQRFGTSDNYSTQTGELEHRRVKQFYARTNKIQYTQQIAHHEQHKCLLNSINTRLQAAQLAAQSSPQNDDSLPPTLLRQHHHIGESNREYDYVTQWAFDHHDDPANFIPRLQDHILSRLSGHAFDGDEHEYTNLECNTVSFVNDRLYTHKWLRVNYTTYNMQRAQDTISINNQRDIMVLAHEDDTEDNAHPYWYAHIIGIYHAYVRYKGSRATQTQRMEYLWVRWLGRDMRHRSGFSLCRLPRVGFLPSNDPNYNAFGFLDPAEVIRAIHLIPAFAHGRTTTLLTPKSMAHRPQDEGQDWEYYYVNMFADRDMIMQFVGRAIRHISTHHASQRLTQETAEIAAARHTHVGGQEDQDSLWVDEEDIQVDAAQAIVDAEEGEEDMEAMDLIGQDDDVDDDDDGEQEVAPGLEDSEEPEDGDLEGFAVY